MKVQVTATSPCPLAAPSLTICVDMSTDIEALRIAATQAVFLDITRMFDISFVPDLFHYMRHRPAYLETAWELFKDELNLEHQDRQTKLIIALAITTDQAGLYFATAVPHAFRLNALDPATYRKIVSMLRFFRAFERYLSGITPAYALQTERFVNDCLREEYESYEASRVYEETRTTDDRHPPVRGVRIVVILSVLSVCAVGLYLIVA